MRKVLIAALVSLSLAGCATPQWLQTVEKVVSAVTLGGATVSNPVTRSRLNQMENAMIVVVAGLQTWRDSCEQHVIPATCFDQIAQVQVYTRQIPPYLEQLRAFVKNNNQVNAMVVWNEVLKIIATVKAGAAAGGVAISVDPGVI